MSFLRNSLFYRIYSALIRDQNVLANSQWTALLFWGLVLAVLDLAGLAVVVQLIALSVSDNHSILPIKSTGSVWFFVSLFLVKNALVLWIHSRLLDRMYDVAQSLAHQKYLEYMHPSNLLNENRTSPQALHQLNGLVFGFADGILMPVVHFVAEGLLLIAIAFALFIYHPAITGVLFILLLPITAAILLYNRKALKENNQKISDIQHTLYQNTSELIHGNTELVLHGIANQYYQQFSNAVQAFLKLKKEYALRHNQLSFRTIEFSAILGLALMLQSMGKTSGVFLISPFSAQQHSDLSLPLTASLGAILPYIYMPICFVFFQKNYTPHPLTLTQEIHLCLSKI